jgi:GAF domain-containing protein
MLTLNDKETEPAESALKVVAEAARRLFAADLCLVAPVNPVTGEFYARPSAAAGGDADVPADLDNPLLYELARKALNSERLCEERSFGEPDDGGSVTAPFGMQTFFAIPLRSAAGDHRLAVLWLCFSRQHSFDAKDEARLESFTGQFIPFLQNVWQLKRFKQVLLTGQEMNNRLITVEALFEAVRHGVADILDLSYFCMLALYQPYTDTIDMYYSRGDECGFIPNMPLERTGASAIVIKTREPLIISTCDDDRRISLVPEESTDDHPESLIFVPLMFHDTPLGVLSVQCRSPYAFDESDLQVISLLANQIALAINNLLLFKHLTTLNDIGQTLTQQLDSTELPGLVVESIREATGADVVTIFPYDESTGQFYEVTMSGALMDSTPPVASSRRPDDIARLATKRGTPLWATDRARLYELLGGEGQTRRGDFELRERIASTAVVPLRIGDSTTGVLFVNYRQPQHFDATQRTLILSLADYASIALRNSHALLALSRRRLEELEALREIEQKIVTQLDDPDQVIRVVLTEAMKLIGADSCELHLYEEDRLGTTYSARKNDGTILQPRRYDAGEAPPSRQGIVMHVATTWVPYICSDTATDPIYWGGADVQSEVAFPLISDRELVGVLDLGSGKRAAFKPDDLRLLEVFVGQAVIAIRKAKAYGRAKLESSRFKLLYEVGHELGKITEPEQLETAYDIVVRNVGEFSDGEVDIRRYDPVTEALVLVRVGRERQTPPPPSIPMEVGVNGQAARELRTICIADVNALPPDVAYTGDGPTFGTLIVTPLVFENSYYGNLMLSHERAHSFHDDDIDLLKGLAGQLAITINRIESSQARVEAERRANEAMLVSQLGQSMMALIHRLSNDLGAVRVHAMKVFRIAQEQGLDIGLIGEDLDSIIRNVSNVVNTTKNLRETASAVGGRKHLGEQTLVNVSDLLERARISLPPLPTNVSLRWDCHEPSSTIRVAPEQITDILYNLVVNAAQAMPEGGEISVRSYISRSNLFIEVSDTGPGIREETQTKLFNLFFSTKQNSLGFGLWSARQYSRANGGDLTYESHKGGGTTFLLRLPLAYMREEAE